MTEPAPRRRPLLLGLGVLAVVVVALAAWILSRPAADATSARDRALGGVLRVGGPDGWPVTAAPADAPAEVLRAGQPAEFDGSPVLVGDRGFAVVWAADTAPGCAELATWAAGRVAPEVGPRVTAGCPGSGTIATHTIASGEYTFTAWQGAGGLYAALIYTVPARFAPASSPNALR